MLARAPSRPEGGELGLPPTPLGVRFLPAPEVPAFATAFFADAACLDDAPGFVNGAGREGVRCAVFLRFDFLASAAIQMSPRRMLSERGCTPLGQVCSHLTGTQPKLWELAS